MQDLPNFEISKELLHLLRAHGAIWDLGKVVEDYLHDEDDVGSKCFSVVPLDVLENAVHDAEVIHAAIRRLGTHLDRVGKPYFIYVVSDNL